MTATLQCAGNRRAGLIAIRDIPGEAPWGPGATGTATWTGVALADVLALAGPLREAAHVGFDGADLCPEAKPAQRFGGSIPLDKACRPEVLLAWAMNGEPLPPVHGAPLRVVVPGYIGARSVKWLERIEVRVDAVARATSSTSSTGCCRRTGRRARARGCRSAWSRSTPTCCRRPTARRSRPARSRCAATRSRAGSGTSRGSTSRSTAARRWSQAELLDDLGRWAWRHWRITVDLAPGEHEILVRAWDSSAATQPEDEAALWNPKGYVNNARPRVRVTAR